MHYRYWAVGLLWTLPAAVCRRLVLPSIRAPLPSPLAGSGRPPPMLTVDTQAAPVCHEPSTTASSARLLYSIYPPTCAPVCNLSSTASSSARLLYILQPAPVYHYPLLYNTLQPVPVCNLSSTAVSSARLLYILQPAPVYHYPAAPPPVYPPSCAGLPPAHLPRLPRLPSVYKPTCAGMPATHYPAPPPPSLAPCIHPNLRQSAAYPALPPPPCVLASPL